MRGCSFTKKLDRLRKSSSDSIDNIDIFDNFKQYMHVVRDAEEDLKTILRAIKATNRKTLVLLCGSAGDGKSHLLSYLKNSNQEGLLEDYIIHNDATESSAPDKTAIETLYDLLSGYKDENLEKPGKNVILAINLGILSNFIESEYGKEFRKLKEYVVKTNILTSKVNDDEYDNNSSFQHISFSDYHMFLINKTGINPEYIEKLFEKIIDEDVNNPFYQAYKTDCMICPLESKCPVKMNYDYLRNSNVRHFMANMIIKVIIKDKEILTTRELLNYVYDILVAQSFDFSMLQKSSVNMSKFLKNYLECIMPTIIFDSNDITTIMNRTQKYDPLLMRDEEADDVAIEYYVAEDVSKTVNEYLKESPYLDVLGTNKAIDVINEDRALKSKVFNILIRTKSMLTDTTDDKLFMEYICDLYSYNAGKIPGLSTLYSDIEEAVVSWCGNESEGNICIDDTHKGLSLYENIDFEAYIDNIPQEKDDDNLQRFLPYIVVEYQGNDGKSIHLDVDFSLYELIKKLKAGYIQTAEDRNNHADFISFISKMLKTGSADKNIIVLAEDGRKAVLEKTKFGVYKFKVVK